MLKFFIRVFSSENAFLLLIIQLQSCFVNNEKPKMSKKVTQMYKFGRKHLTDDIIKISTASIRRQKFRQLIGRILCHEEERTYTNAVTDAGRDAF